MRQMVESSVASDAAREPGPGSSAVLKHHKTRIAFLGVSRSAIGGYADHP